MPDSVEIASVTRLRRTYSEYDGKAMAARIAMIATTTISSSRVNPRGRLMSYLWATSVKSLAGPRRAGATNGAAGKPNGVPRARDLHNLTTGRHASAAVALQRLQNGGGRHAAQRRPTRPLENDEAQLAVARLLVEPHQLEVAIVAEPRRGRRQAGSPDDAREPIRQGARDQSEPSRQVGGQHHAAADRLAVQPAAVAAAGLDRMGEGVTE